MSELAVLGCPARERADRVPEAAPRPRPGRGALALVRRAASDKAREAVAEYPTLIRTSLSTHHEEELAAAVR